MKLPPKPPECTLPKATRHGGGTTARDKAQIMVVVAWDMVVGLGVQVDVVRVIRLAWQLVMA